MTSPVDTTVKWFTNKMLGSPVLKGQAGSLIALLDACLVNGWGAQAASSVVVAGGVCTMTFPLDHAAPVDAVILVAGASIAALNGEQKVTATAPNVVKFATAAANGTATGTITAKMAPVGWAKPFSSGSTVGVYKSLDVAANGQFCRVNDASAQYARVIGYETMTGVSTGTGLFPTATQLSGGVYWMKSSAAGTLPISWTIVGDSRFFAILPAIQEGIDPATYGNSGPCFFAFGDPINYSRSADPFSTILFGFDVDNNGYSFRYFFEGNYSHWRYMPRAVGAAAGAVNAVVERMSSTSEDASYDRVSGRLFFTKAIVKTYGSASWRAEIPGIHVGTAEGMNNVFSPYSIFKGDTPEKSFLALLGGYGTNEQGQAMAIDVTGPWR